MINKHKNLILFVLFVSVLAPASLLLRFVTSDVNPFLNDSDIYWVEDATKSFIRKNKKMPENWADLRNYQLYQAVEGIEYRIEINFDFMKSVNTGIEIPSLMDDNARKTVWLYRFYKAPKARINQESIIDEFIQNCVHE